jgi:hypothetical protein
MPKVDELAMRARVGEILNRWPAMGLAVGVLMVRALTPMPALYRGFPLHPDDEQDPYVFRLDPVEVRDGHGPHRVQPRSPRRHDNSPRRSRGTAAVAPQANRPDEAARLAH